MMSKALRWVRKSKGKDDDVGLELQREKTRELAEAFADEVDTLDLGVHTGFSIHSRASDDERIDANPDVVAAVEALEAGEYDYLVAWDDTRLARDEYYATIERACLLGDVEVHFIEDVDDDTLAFDVRRVVEKRVKQNEIRKSKQARARRRENGYWEGRPRWGTQYDDDKAFLEPGKDFEDALLAIRMAASDDPEFSYGDILDATVIGSKGTLKNILERADWYFDLAAEHEVELPDVPTPVDA